MKKRLFKTALILFCSILSSLSVYAFEDAIIFADGKITEIKIDNNKIVDIFPLITIMNDKNTLIIHPLSIGNTKASVLKDNKEKIVFGIKVSENKTEVENIKGLEILSMDAPPEFLDCNLDMPPKLRTNERGK